MLIDFEVIPHKHQRYETVGDYYHLDGFTWAFRVSKMKDKRYPILVFLHEMIEFFMCRLAGVKMKDIDRFDIAYEAARKAEWPDAACGCKMQEEPGDDKHAPYHLQHQTATQCEKIIAKALGVNWKEYNDTVESL